MRLGSLSQTCRQAVYMSLTYMTGAEVDFCGLDSSRYDSFGKQDEE